MQVMSEINCVDQNIIWTYLQLQGFSAFDFGVTKLT